MFHLPRSRLSQNPLLILSIALVLGIIAARYLQLTPKLTSIAGLVATTLLAVFIVVCVRANKFVAASVLTALTFLIAGGALTALANRGAEADRIKCMLESGTLEVSEPVELTGVITSQPELAPNGLYLSIEAERIRARNAERSAKGTVLLLARVPDLKSTSDYEALELRYGARIRVMTVLAREDDYRNPGVMPFTEYLDRKDFDATGMIKSPLLIERLDDARVFLPLAWLYDWRTKLHKQFVATFSPETAGVLAAALLGNRYGLSRVAADRFRTGGTFHVLVISGLHISFIGGLVLLLIRRLTSQRLWHFAIATTFLWAYTLAVGAEAPVARAALLFTLVIFAPIIWRRASSLNVIGATSLTLLVWRPNDLFDPSFQLTFLSVVSIVVLSVPLLMKMQAVGSWRPTHATPYPPTCPAWFRRLSEAAFWSNKSWKAEMAASNLQYRLFKVPLAARLEAWRLQTLLRFALAAIVTSGSVQIGMLPVLIIYFHRVSYASLVLNIFVGAAMAAVALLGIAAVLIAQVSSTTATLLVWLTEKLDWLMVHAVDPFDRLGIASYRLPSYRGWGVLVYAAYFAVLMFLIVALARWNPLGRLSPISRHSTLIKMAVFIFAALLGVVVMHPRAAAPPDGKLHIDFLDVGQGDAALVTMPDGATLLIDGGGRPNIDARRSDDDDSEPEFERDTRSIGERVVSEYLWWRGLDRVDYVLATHADADHIDGLNDVARNFKVRGAIVARTPAADREFEKFVAAMKQAAVPIDQIGAGDVLKFGNTSFDALWPSASTDRDATYGNNDGIVLRLRYGEKTLLFAADIEKPTEASLLRSRVDLHADLLKVAHHGSRTSSTEPFVNASCPAIAVVSVGRTSIFGHPHKEVIERWRLSGAQVMTTGEKGTISVVTDGKDLKISTYVP